MVYQWKEVNQGVMYQAFEKYGDVGIIKTMALDSYCWRQLMLLKETMSSGWCGSVD